MNDTGLIKKIQALFMDTPKDGGIQLLQHHTLVMGREKYTYFQTEQTAHDKNKLIVKGHPSLCVITPYNHLVYSPQTWRTAGETLLTSREKSPCAHIIFSMNPSQVNALYTILSQKPLNPLSVPTTCALEIRINIEQTDLGGKIERYLSTEQYITSAVEEKKKLEELLAQNEKYGITVAENPLAERESRLALLQDELENIYNDIISLFSNPKLFVQYEDIKDSLERAVILYFKAAQGCSQTDKTGKDKTLK